MGHRLDGQRGRRRWRLLLALPALAAVLATGCVAEGTWTLQDVEQPQPPLAPTVDFTSVDCPAPGECVAAALLQRGRWPSENVVLRQDGSGWAIVALPGDIGSTFASVSCRAVDDCLVVGDPLDVQLGAGGPRWVLAPSGAHADTADETVDCVAEGCLRVRGSGSWWWDGTSWGPRVELPAGFQPSERRLACTSSTQCLAMASEAWMHGLVEGPMPGPVTVTEWDGSAWSPIVTIDENRGAGLACPTVDSCFASLGTRSFRQWPPFTFGPNAGLAHWDGTVWSTVPVAWPGTAPTEPPMLACDGATSCTFQTVQGWTMGGPDYLGRWDGVSWTVTPAPAARFLDVLSCPSPGDCVAVGGAAGQRLTGTTWANLTPVAAEPEPSTSLTEVSCARPDMCLAAGLDPTPAYRAFDGTSWTAVAGATSDGIRVDCAPTTCFTASPGGVVQRWDGTSLSDLDPIPVPTNGRLLDLDCPSAQWCIAIAGTGSAPDTPAALTWSPSSGWTPLALPAVAGLVLEARGVACDAPDSCLAAVGTSGGPGLGFQRLSGGAWTALAPPPAAVAALRLSDVDCPTPDTCVVVGASGDTFARVQAVVRAGAWEVSAPGSGSGFAVDARVDCWAADGCAVSSRSGMAVLRGTRWLAVALPPGTQEEWDISCPAPFTCEVVGPLVDGDVRSPAARLDLVPPA